MQSGIIQRKLQLVEQAITAGTWQRRPGTSDRCEYMVLLQDRSQALLRSKTEWLSDGSVRTVFQLCIEHSPFDIKLEGPMAEKAYWKVAESVKKR